MILHLDSSTVRVDSSLESYHRLLDFDGFSDFFGNLDESVLFTNNTVSMTVGLQYYTCFHKRNPRTIPRDGRKDSRRPMQDISSHELVCLSDRVPKLVSKESRLHHRRVLAPGYVSKLSALPNSDL